MVEEKTRGFKYNFYEILGVSKDANKQDIILSYKNKIKKYNNLELNDENIHKIKTLKVGLYILINSDLRNKYNEQLSTSNMFDNLFKINKPESIQPNEDDRVKNNIIGERIFSLPFNNANFNIVPLNEDFIRNPIQGRADKTDGLISKKSQF